MAIKKISDNIFEIEKEGKMLVPGIIFASDSLFEKIKSEKETINQIKNAAQLPGIVEKSIAMPDAHMGYGLCVGGVIAFDTNKGIISPGAIGFDINCGVRLLATNIPKEDFLFKRDQILNELYKNVPSGVGEGGEFKLSDKEIIEVLNKGSKWALDKGFATKEDLEHTEDNGCIPNADSTKISQKANCFHCLQA